MSVLMYTGFGASNSFPPEVISSTQMGVTVGGGRNGGNYASYTASNGSNMTVYIGGTNSHLIVGIAFLYSSHTAGDIGMFDFYELTSGVVHLTLQATNTHQIRIVRGGSIAGGGGTSLALTNGVITLNAWNYIELDFLIDDTAGTLTAWLNGSSSPDANVNGLTGLDTRNGGTGYVDCVRTGRPNNGSCTVSLRWSDIYVLNTSGSAPWNARIGDARCAIHRTTANGSNNDSIPSTGTSRSDTIDETTPSTTDYNSLISVGHKDTLVTADLVSSGASIIAVKPIIQALKSDAGTCELCPVIRSGGTDYDLTSQPLNTTGRMVQEIKETDPATGAQWIEANFNAGELVGYKRTA